MTKFPKGSAGAEEQKAETRMKIGLSVATFLVFLSTFVFNTQLKEHMQVASTFFNVLGVVFFAISAGSVWVINKFEWATPMLAGIFWLGGMLAGILFSCGFNFGY